jgi:hypothetical protein
MLVHAVDRPELPPIEMPARFHHDIAYFMTPSGEDGAPELGEGEYWVRLDSAGTWLNDGVLDVVSPLDAGRKAEIEISEDQEAWLEWMVTNKIQHVRLAPRDP